MMMSPLLQNFKTEVIHSEIAKYQYILKGTCSDRDKGCGKICSDVLTDRAGRRDHGLWCGRGFYLFEGCQDPFRKKIKCFFPMDFLEKYGLKEGGKVTLEKKYEDDSYTFTVSGTYDYPATLSVFMSMENF